MEYIENIEFFFGKKANLIMSPHQPGDVLDTFADMRDFEKDFQFKPKTQIIHGVMKFVDWYLKYKKQN
jgi:UDP-glucuronate 4-epimerase